MKKQRKSWRYTKRKINGKSTKVKVRRRAGKEQVRKVGVYSTSDRSKNRKIKKKK